jgi:hypothetical protein
MGCGVGNFVTYGSLACQNVFLTWASIALLDAAGQTMTRLPTLYLGYKAGRRN